jgi:hypothetical protein
VTVRAQDTKVPEPVVGVDTVDMMEFESERAATPCAKTAILAPILFEPRCDEAPPELRPVDLRAVSQNLLQRNRIPSWALQTLRPPLSLEV